MGLIEKVFLTPSFTDPTITVLLLLLLVELFFFLTLFHNRKRLFTQVIEVHSKNSGFFLSK